MPVADVMLSLPVEEVEELPSGTYVWRIHYDSAAKTLLAPLSVIANSIIDAFEAEVGLDFVELHGEDVAAGEKIPPSGYALRWTDSPEVTVIPQAHYDLVLTFKVGSSVAITTLVAIVGIVLIAYFVWLIVSTILEKVPAVAVEIGGIIIIILLLSAAAKRRD